jgi:predicted Zn-dependent protease with MMP-like domain
MSDRPPTTRRVVFAAAVALVLGLAAIGVYANGGGGSWGLRVLEGVAVFAVGVAILSAVVAFVITRLAGWRNPVSDEDFDKIVERAERLAAEDSWGDSEDYEYEDDDDDEQLLDPYDEEDFKALVRSALDDLPLEFHRALEHVAVVVSDSGRRRGAYGLYEGGTVARDYFHDRIVIFRDTLLRDFGRDPDRLKAQVTRTVRHELAHHLGWDEKGVRGLGL